MKANYSNEIDKKNILKLRELCSELPDYCKDFFRGIEPRTQSRTRIAYAYDLKVFFTFLTSELSAFRGFTSIRDIPLEALETIKPRDLEEYMEYLKIRKTKDGEIFNKELGIKRKMASLKSFYKYFYKHDLLSQNPTEKVSMPKIRDKEIIRLDIDEVALMLDTVESGDELTKRQKLYHDKNETRDFAIITLLLGTGIRVSECVGINIDDIDFKNYAIRITRKGGKESTIYFSEEVAAALSDYMSLRRELIPASRHEDAFFLSLQQKRLSVRSVENLVKKYAKIVTPLKRITPHKLRSTYGTNLYRETGDIYLVADVLGHSDVNTTKKHYAAIDEDRKRLARNAVKLRDTLEP